ncbi:MAG: Putative lipoprotein thiredoxin [uncultured Sulfurovum sp.]|uniref:Lipoprotein thiredoxin n=1 Tax=uncultured Sulfurovum sp. TaxID=269237 RepID=A0A6S6S810_9BACT|nr:MAG: Putative lipoprotein thiredoxin [uncultured Sulfurovum sp.]
MKKLLLTLIFTFTTLLYATETPSFTLTTIDDKNITVSQLQISKTESGLDFHEFRGKAVLLSLFGYRCPPCIKEIPEFIKLTNKHKNTNDLEIITIESQQYPTDKLKDFVAKHEMNYNVIAGIEHNDFIDYIATMAGYGRGIPLPLLVAINKDGEVEQVRAGLIREDELEMLIDDLND